jgi:hypothetical protein
MTGVSIPVFSVDQPIGQFYVGVISLTLANSEQAHRPRGMRNIGSLSTIS